MWNLIQSNWIFSLIYNNVVARWEFQETTKSIVSYFVYCWFRPSSLQILKHCCKNSAAIMGKQLKTRLNLYLLFFGTYIYSLPTIHWKEKQLILKINHNESPLKHIYIMKQKATHYNWLRKPICFCQLMGQIVGRE